MLVYDVSRWGRFQDADESSYYEHLCRRAGINVHYCAEPFKNDGTIYAAIVKSIKRAMAAEYSRELSVKVYAGAANLARRGFRVGGGAPYGMRRLLVDRSFTPKRNLRPGEHKSLQHDRVTLVPGPPEEIAIVRRIFSAFVREHKSESTIANELNAEGIDSGLPRPWTYARIRWLLRNEIYSGAIVWNRTTTKLSTRKRSNPPEEWVRRATSFAPIVARDEFEAARSIFRQRLEPYPKEQVLESLRCLAHKHSFLDQRLIDETPGMPPVRQLFEVYGGIKQIRKILGAKSRPGPPWYFLSDEDLLAAMRRLLRKKGRLTRATINKSKELPHASVYESRFGSLVRTYQLIGYVHHRANGFTREEAIEALRKVLRRYGRISTALIAQTKGTPSVFSYRKHFGSLPRAYALVSYKTEHPKRQQWRTQ